MKAEADASTNATQHARIMVSSVCPDFHSSASRLVQDSDTDRMQAARLFRASCCTSRRVATAPQLSAIRSSLQQQQSRSITTREDDPVPDRSAVYKYGKHRSDAEQRIAKVPIIEVDGELAVCTGGETRAWSKLVTLRSLLVASCL